MSNSTKNAIKASVIKLIGERPLSKITVKEIAADCGINRNSFYYHYQDVPSLIEEIVRDDVDRIINMYPTVDSFEKCLDIAFEFMNGNRRAALHIYNSVNRDIFDNYLWRMCKYVVETYFDTAFCNKRIKQNDKNVLIRFYMCLMFGEIIGWLQNGMEGDIAEFNKHLRALRFGMPSEIADRSESENK